MSTGLSQYRLMYVVCNKSNSKIFCRFKVVNFIIFVIEGQGFGKQEVYSSTALWSSVLYLSYFLCLSQKIPHWIKITYVPLTKRYSSELYITIRELINIWATYFIYVNCPLGAVDMRCINSIHHRPVQVLYQH